MKNILDFHIIILFILYIGFLLFEEKIGDENLEWAIQKLNKKSGKPDMKPRKKEFIAFGKALRKTKNQDSLDKIKV